MRRSFSSIVDVDLLGLGQHQDAGGAGVHPALRLGDRHPLHAVHAALELQQGVRRLARLGRALGLHRDGDRLVAAEVGLGGVEDLGLPAAPLGVPGVHAQQVAGEQRRLLAALARLHLEDRVLVVGRVARDEQPAQPLLGASPRCVASGSASAANVGVLGRRARGRPRCRRRVCCHSRQVATTGAQLGVPLVELLGQPGVGVRRGRAELALELGVLGDQSCSTASNIGDFSRLDVVVGQMNDAGPARCGGPASSGSYLESASASALASGRSSWRSGPRTGPRGRRCRGSSACRCRTGGSASTRRRG